MSAVPALDSRDVDRLMVRVDNADYETSYRYELWSAIFRVQLRLLPLAWLPVWFVLYVTVSNVAFISAAPGAAGGTAISAAIALSLPIAFVRSQVRSSSAGDWLGQKSIRMG